MRHLKIAAGAAGLLMLAAAWARAGVDYQRTEDVIYGRKFGTALTLDVFRPAQTNGCGILLMVSGGWYSSHDGINLAWFEPLLARGYTVFTVVHGSQPKFTVPEIEQDIHRAVRFVRFNAGRYGVDPNRLGITGGSAGGHLSLTMAVKGRNGQTDAKDPVDRQSSAVQCVACFFPPTDFLNYNRPGDDAVGVGTLKDFKPAFGPLSETPEGRQKLGREISPIYFVNSNQPPVFIVHGDADKLVPIYQAERFVEASVAVGAKAKLGVRPGKQHGWADMARDIEAFADWFDEHLRGLGSRGAGSAEK